MFGDFFNNKPTIVTIFIAFLLILFFVFSFAIVLIQEKIEDTVYTTKERLRKSAVLLIGSTVNVAIAWFIYSYMVKPMLDRMSETESSFGNNEIEQNVEQGSNYEYVPTVDQGLTYENIPTPANENNYVDNNISDIPAYTNTNENTVETSEIDYNE